MISPTPLQTGGNRASGPSLLASIKGKLVFKPLVYGYANARVHGLYSQFLTPEQLHALTIAPTTDSMVELLERTSYKEDLVALSLQFKGDDLMELAVSRNFARFATKLLNFCPAGAEPVLRAILARWDVHNLKIVLLARRQKKTFESVLPYLVLAGTLDEDKLRLFYSAPDPETIYHLLRVGESGQILNLTLENEPRMTERLRKTMLAIDSVPTLQLMMDELDRLTYFMTLKATSGFGDKDMASVISLLSAAADEKNLSTILRLRAVGVRPSEVRKYLVPGGHFPENKWVALASEGPESPAFRSVCARMGWAGALVQYDKDHSLSNFEVSMARLSAMRSIKAFRSSQMSIGVLVGALLLKEQDMGNIRKVIRGKTLRLPPAEIEKMLVHAHS